MNANPACARVLLCASAGLDKVRSKTDGAEYECNRCCSLLGDQYVCPSSGQVIYIVKAQTTCVQNAPIWLKMTVYLSSLTLFIFHRFIFLFCISLSIARPLGRLQDWGTIQGFQNLMNSKRAHMGFSNLCVLISDGRFGESGSSQHLKVQIPNHKTKGKLEFSVRGSDVVWMLPWEWCTNTQQGCSIVSLLGWKYPD